MRATTCCSVGVRLSQPWRGRFRSPRARRAYRGGRLPVEAQSFAGCPLSVVVVEVVGGELAGDVDGPLFESETPPVVEFVAEALACGQEPEALGPALGAGRGGGEAFEGVNGDEPEIVFEGDLEG